MTQPAILLAGLFSVFLLVSISNAAVLLVGHSRNKERLEDLPHCRYGLLLGTGPDYLRSDGTIAPNRYYQVRLAAAVQVYDNGYIDALVVSGGHLECEAMQKDLSTQGVPAEAIFSDTEGYNTYRSLSNLRPLLRAGETFLIITQHYYAYRAVFIALALGMKPMAYGHGCPLSFRNKLWPLLQDGRPAGLLREWLARTKAVLQYPACLLRRSKRYHIQ